MERNVLEFVDHLHEHFLNPCSINKQGRYNVPDKADEGYRYVWSMICVRSRRLIDIMPAALKCIRIVSRSMSGRTVRIGRV